MFVKILYVVGKSDFFLIYNLSRSFLLLIEVKVKVISCLCLW
jgi:hypothetical protein